MLKVNGMEEYMYFIWKDLHNYYLYMKHDECVQGEKVSYGQSDKATALTSILFWMMNVFLYQESKLSGLWPSHIWSICIA